MANQQAKEEILAEAEKLDPSTDLRGAQNALRKLQERYDAIGHVPRGVMRQLEDRMQAVEQRVRGAVDSTRARVAPDPGVAGRAQHFGRLRRAQQRAHDRVLAAARADDEDPHARSRAQIEPMKSSIGMAASDS